MPTRIHPWLAAALLAVMAAFALALIPGREFWLDESHSAYVAALPLPRIWVAVTGDVHPPLYFLAVHGWVAALGTNPTSLRLYSFVCMMVAAALVWRTAAEHDGATAAIVGLAFFGLSPAILYYAVEARMYALLMLGFGATLLFTSRAERSGRVGAAVGAGCAAAAAIYTHYVALFAVSGLFGVWLIVALRARRHVRACIAACLTCGILVAPWVPTLVSQRARKAAQVQLMREAAQQPEALAYGVHGRPSTRVPQRTVRTLVEDAASIVGVYPARSKPGLALLSLPFALLATLVVWAALRGDAWLLMLLGASVATLAGVLLLDVPGRRFLLCLVALDALAVAHIVSLTNATRMRRVVAGAAACCVILMTAGTVRMERVPRLTPINDLITYLQTNAQPTDRLLFHAAFGQIPFEYYANRRNLALPRAGFPMSTVDWWSSQAFQGWGTRIPTRGDVDSVITALSAKPSRSGAVWLLLSETEHYDPAEILLSSLEKAVRRGRSWVSSDSAWRVVEFRVGEP